MATIIRTPGEAGVSIGGILSQAFGAMGANPVAIFGIAFLFGALPAQIFSYFWRMAIFGSFGLSTVLSVTVAVSSYAFLLFCSALTQGAIIRAMAAFVNGAQASIGECIQTGLSKAIPLVGLTVLFFLGMMIGFALFVIPGVILIVMWSVSVPTLISEPVGVFGALGRSRALTKGVRWRVFGMLLLLLVVLWAVSGLLSLALTASGASLVAIATTKSPFPIWYACVSAIVSTFTTALISTTLTSLYLALRNWKDGPQGEALAEIFA